MFTFDDYIGQIIKAKAYQLIEDKFKPLNDVIKMYNEHFNNYGAHANLHTAVVNTAVSDGKDKLIVNFFDVMGSMVVKNKLLIIADIMWGFCDAIIKLRVDNKILPLKEGAAEKVEEFHRTINKLQRN